MPRNMEQTSQQPVLHVVRQANGLTEKVVHIVKNVLRKDVNLNEGLTEYHNIPISHFPKQQPKWLKKEDVMIS